MHKRLEKVVDALAVLQKRIDEVRMGDFSNEQQTNALHNLKNNVDYHHKFFLNEAMREINETELEGSSDKTKAFDPTRADSGIHYTNVQSVIPYKPINTLTGKCK